MATHINIMKNRYAFDSKGLFTRTSLLLLFLLSCIMASAQQVEVTLTEAGTLPEKITSNQKYSITSLKISGPINGTDVRYLREMAGVDCVGDSTEGKLVDLDLTDAKIVEGGEYYYYTSYDSSYYCSQNDTIGAYMFEHVNLRCIKLPNSVTSIGDGAFFDCRGLTSITIPNSVTSIGDGAFCDCSGLTSITIPNSVTSIGDVAFRACSGLISITIPNSVTSIGGSAFSACSGLTSITIPNSVTSIGNSAFAACSGLISITIPNSVTSIDSWAFYDCTALVSLISYSTTPPTCWTEALDGINKNKCTLYVPAEAIDAYKAADQWKDFVHVESIDKYLAGVTQTEMNKNEKVLRRYDINGRQISQPSKGLNILMMSNSTTKKVLVK